MKSLIVGLIGIVLVVAMSIEGGLDTYLQKHSIILVIGGTVVVYLFSTTDKVLFFTIKAFRDLFKREESLSDYASEFVELSKNKRLLKSSQNSLINYAVELWEQGVDPNLFVTLLSQKRMELETESISVVQAFRNLSKYPPALGMTGTVMGMIALFSKIDSSKSNIGGEIALAMTATFFGLLIANTLVSPFSDRLHVRYVSQKKLYQNLYQVILLINQNEPVALIASELEERVA